jgi:hypothetical protein
MVCVGDVGPGGSGETSPCYGDSGGPLTVLDGGRPVLIGLVLGGFRCGDPNYPAVFTEVASVRSFLVPYLDPDSVPRPVQGLDAVRRGPRDVRIPCPISERWQTISTLPSSITFT